MKEQIAVAGSTGNLGKRITKALIERGAEVVALVRADPNKDKSADLKQTGAKVTPVNMSNVDELAKALEGTSCVVSALQGLHEVIVDAQAKLLAAAIKANVPRFIPSDYCVDFRSQPDGLNRNFDLRREFHTLLDRSPIRRTSIFNGAFSDILMYGIPLYDTKKQTIGYWGDPDWHVDFTTMDDTAAFTSAAALDPDTPEALHIASFQVSANELHRFTADVLGTPFQLVRIGSVAELDAQNKRDRAAHPEGEKDLYSSWQQGQYMQSMFSAHNDSLDNSRYSNLTWTSLNDVLKSPVQQEKVSEPGQTP